ncbi:MAG: FkbM family methyltransferase [Acidimicrobiales bacterium]
MSFVSYSQNFEDVLLHRALRSISKGHYVDVGAGDPKMNSVTKAFYDAGWTGINIEPLPFRFQRLVAERPRDVNLGIVVSDTNGTVPFFAVDGYDELSTTLADGAIAYKEAGRLVHDCMVESRTLASVCEEFAQDAIHFLKVDVEGGELAVLSGADFVRFRPWILVIESSWAGNDAPDQEAWEELVLSADYLPVYFDGLNRFFVSAERHEEIAPAFSFPVCVRDDFIRSDARADMALNRIAAMLESQSGSDEHEILERLEHLREDRIKFELQANAAIEEVGALQANLEDLQKACAGHTAELESFWQQSFERERYIAWQASEIAWQASEIARQASEIARQENALRQLDQRAVAADAAVAATQLRVDDLLTSTSWRATLLLRALRHPAKYLSILLARR